MATVPFLFNVPNAVLDVQVIHKDLLQLTLSQAAIVNDTLLDRDNYIVQTLAGGTTLGVKRVLPPPGLTTTVIRVVTDTQTDGIAYTITVDTIKFVDGTTEAGYRVFYARPTKVSAVLGSLPKHFTRTPNSNFRTVVEALALEDERIGGSQGDPIT